MPKSQCYDCRYESALRATIFRAGNVTSLSSDDASCIHNDFYLIDFGNRLLEMYQGSQ